jgi:hypothetical protein
VPVRTRWEATRLDGEGVASLRNGPIRVGQVELPAAFLRRELDRCYRARGISQRGLSLSLAPSVRLTRVGHRAAIVHYRCVSKGSLRDEETPDLSVKSRRSLFVRRTNLDLRSERDGGVSARKVGDEDEPD